jgi:hypothetical protein
MAETINDTMDFPAKIQYISRELQTCSVDYHFKDLPSGVCAVRNDH